MDETDAQIRLAITAQAAEWFTAQRGDALDDRQRAAFFAWLKTSPAHIEEYLALAAIASDLTAATADSTLSLQALRELARSDNASNVTALPSAPPMIDRTSPPIKAHERRRRLALGWGNLGVPAVAAAAIAAAAVGILWGVLDRSWLDSPTTYQTASGSQRVWHLPDGSAMHLNSDSAATVHFSSAERRIDIGHGQAFFEVAHDRSRPFHVIAGSANTVAVGTEFDVDRRLDSTLITVVQGQVAVYTAATGVIDATGAPAARSLQVSAGQQVRISAGQLPEAPTAAHLYQAEAWLQRQIVFKHRPLGEVAAEFSRYNAVPITITDPALSALPVSGVFNAYDIDSFMSFLRSLDNVQVDQLPTGIRVSRTRAKPLA